jgi:hypothetical protein
MGNRLHLRENHLTVTRSILVGGEALLWGRFQGMSGEAREQIKHLFDTVDAMDKKRRRSRGPKS